MDSVGNDGCVALLTPIAATVSWLHMHPLVEVHGQPGWVGALIPLSVDGMIVAALTALLLSRGWGAMVGAAVGASARCARPRKAGLQMGYGAAVGHQLRTVLPEQRERWS